jgi:hypothetical protein
MLAAAIAGVPKVEVYLAGPADWLGVLFESAQAKGLNPEGWHYAAID